MKKITYFIVLPLLVLSSQLMAQTLNAEQQRVVRALLSPYGHCVSVESHAASRLVQGVSLALRENHTPDCWGGKGDPNTAPVFKRLEIDRFGRVFEEQAIDGTLKLLAPANDTVKVIDNIAAWSHPTKKVFADYGIQVLHLELVADKTLPFFTVADHALLTDESNNTRQQLFKRLLKANAQWDFVITTESGQQYVVEGKKRKVPDVSQLTIR
ncbi:MAG: hypothetical protein CSA45_04370 [Gammaproteobacteria bacterium]|nr:MAG: hypothetical protein CSA45_04370 [Gammaproteobacteria bacterium]